MHYEIVLKAGQQTVKVSEIASLMANAIHPEPPEGRTAGYLNRHNEVEQEHRSALMANVRYGTLLVLSAKTNLPTDENNPAGFVTMEAFINYAEQFNVKVRFIVGNDNQPNPH